MNSALSWAAVSLSAARSAKIVEDADVLLEFYKDPAEQIRLRPVLLECRLPGTLLATPDRVRIGCDESCFAN